MQLVNILISTLSVKLTFDLVDCFLLLLFFVSNKITMSVEQSSTNSSRTHTVTVSAIMYCVGAGTVSVTPVEVTSEETTVEMRTSVEETCCKMVVALTAQDREFIQQINTQQCTEFKITYWTILDTCCTGRCRYCSLF